MNFERLAIHALERGDASRALFLLIEGLKRQHGSPEALHMLLRLYLEQAHSPGLEPDLIAIIRDYPEAPAWLAQLLDVFEEDARPRMAEALLHEALRAGLRPVMPADPADAFEIVEVETLPPSSTREASPYGELITLDEARPTGSLEADLLTSSPQGSIQGSPQDVQQDEPADPARDDAQAAPRSPYGDEPGAEPLSAEAWAERRASFIARQKQPTEPGSSTLDPSATPRSDAASPDAQALIEVSRAAPLPRPHQRPAPALRRWRGASFVGVMVFFLGLVVWSWWSARDSAHALDHQLERLDPLNAQAFERSLDQAAARWGVDAQEVEERRGFLHALMGAWLLQAPKPALGPSPQTSWGLAALAIEASASGQLEAALLHVTTLEHRWPDRLPTLWARAHVEARRGRYEDAMRAYTRAHERYPQFVTGALARVELALERDDELRWRAAREQLARLQSVHPYLEVSPEAGLDEEDFLRARRSPAPPAPAVAPSQGRFLAARGHYLRAAQAWRRGDLAAAAEHTAQAAQLAPAWFDARLLQIAVLAARNQPDQAITLALEQASRQDLAPRARLRLMTVAPWALMMAGQPEQALRLCFDPGEGPSRRDWLKGLKGQQRAVQDARPTPLSLPPSLWRAYPRQAGQAGLVWAETLLDAGHPTHALEVLAWLEQQQLIIAQGRLLRVWALLRLRRQGDYQAALAPLRDEPEGHLARAAVSLLEGQPERALAELERAPEQTLDLALGVRVHVAVRLASRQPEQALGLLKAQPWTPSALPMIRSLRQRAASLASPDDPAARDLAREIIASSPTSIHVMLDLSFGALTRGELDLARQWAERVTSQEPLHPEAHMILDALLKHARRPAKPGRPLEPSSATVALGEDAMAYKQRGLVSLELGHHEQARQLLYKAVLLDRRDLQALRGLAQVYLAHDPALGRREFERFAQGFKDRKVFRAQYGEVLKWLGVLHGSREGKPEGLARLTQAEREVGPRGDILLEQAEHHRAARDARKARALYIAALQADTTLAGAHLGLAKLALEAQEHAQARDHLLRFIELEPFGERARWARQTLQSMKTL